RSMRRRPRTATSAATTTTSPGSAPTRPKPYAQRPVSGRALSSRLDEEARSGLLADRLLGAVELHTELTCGRLGRAQLDLYARDEPFVVEPVQQVAVVLCEPHD